MVLRVLHVVESVEPEAGSVAILLRGLFDALRLRDIASDIVASNRAPAAGCTFSSVFEPASVGVLVRDAAAVHIHGWHGPLGRYSARAAKKAGKPYVISSLGTLAGAPPKKRSWRDALRGSLGGNRLIRRAAVVTALNILEQQTLRSRGVHADVRVLPYGLSVADYRGATGAAVQLPADSEGRCLLMLGPIHPIEGVVPLMKALAELGTDADGWSVVLAGREDESWRKMLEAAVRRKGAANRVLFTPAPDVATQRAWLKRASIVATPSLHFRCPVSIMQAVAAGVPVIASDRSMPDGLNEVVRSCAPSRKALRETLRGVLRLSDEERAAVAQRAFEVGRALFDWSVLADQYEKLYRGVA